MMVWVIKDIEILILPNGFSGKRYEHSAEKFAFSVTELGVRSSPLNFYNLGIFGIRGGRRSCSSGRVGLLVAEADSAADAKNP